MTPGLRRIVVCPVLVAALAASSPAASRAAGSAQIQMLETGKLKVCLYAGFAPFASKNQAGKWEGWDVDYVEAFAKEVNLTFEVVEKNFDGIWLEPGKNACDIAGTGISDTADRRKATGTAGVWSNTYYGVVRTFLVRTEQFANLSRIGDLGGRTVIVTKGSTANSDICYRMGANHLHPCEQPGDRPCDLPGLDLKSTRRARDPRCVTITYPRNNEERNAAEDVTNGGAGFSPFAYGGGYGSIQTLVCDSGRTQALATVWPHCNMSSDLKHAYAEPFSFVVRAAHPGLAHALNCFIEGHKYQGTPIPDLGCPRPPWTPQSDTACSK
jgi:hypothetical protein